MTAVKMYEVGVAVIDGDNVSVVAVADPAVSPYQNQDLAIRRAQMMQERNRRASGDIKYIPVFDIVGQDGTTGRVNHNGEFEES